MILFKKPIGNVIKTDNIIFDFGGMLEQQLGVGNDQTDSKAIQLIWFKKKNVFKLNECHQKPKYLQISNYFVQRTCKTHDGNLQ